MPISICFVIHWFVISRSFVFFVPDLLSDLLALLPSNYVPSPSADVASSCHVLPVFTVFVFSDCYLVLFVVWQFFLTVFTVLVFSFKFAHMFLLLFDSCFISFCVLLISIHVFLLFSLCSCLLLCVVVSDSSLCTLFFISFYVLFYCSLICYSLIPTFFYFFTCSLCLSCRRSFSQYFLVFVLLVFCLFFWSSSPFIL